MAEQLLQSKSKVLVVFKRSLLDAYQAKGGLPAGMHDAAKQTIHQEHDANARAQDTIRKALIHRRLPYEIVYRSALKRIVDAHLVVVVGGDGTFLHVAHWLRRSPILGINSSVETSEGFFTAGGAACFEGLLEGILDDTLSPMALHRLHVRRNGRFLPGLVLNEVLITHQVPATMARYALLINGHHEEHLSSGIWIAPAAGSTGAVRSAGGRRLDPDEACFQYVVREPYCGRLSKPVTTRGVLRGQGMIHCISMMDRGCIYVDGDVVRHRFRWGDRVTIGMSDCPLQVYGFDKRNIRQYPACPTGFPGPPT